MSAIGTKRTFRLHLRLSAIGVTADIGLMSRVLTAADNHLPSMATGIGCYYKARYQLSIRTNYLGYSHTFAAVRDFLIPYK